MSKPANVVCDGDVCYMVPPGERAPQTSAQSGLANLLGAELVAKDGKVSTASVSGSGKILAIYFSAHWCGPCRMFTPQLAEVYKKFKASHARAADFEIVFVSSDRDQDSFNAYYAEMPWLSLPFEDRERKAKLSAKFKVKGIPTLVILDGEDGSLITANGRESVMSDPEGAEFPWRPPTATQLLSVKLVDKEGKEHDGAAALAGKVKLIYFSAHWCPPCRAFTPVLSATYDKLKAAGKNLECVFISGDRTQEDFEKYMNEQAPWLAVPFGDTKTKGALNNLFDVDGIPTLVVLDEDGKLITSNGRAAVGSDPEGAQFPWRPKPVELLDPMTASSLNKGPVVLLALDDSSAEVAAERAEEVMGRTARDMKAQGVELSFMYGTRSEGIVAQVLEFAKMNPLAAGNESIVLLDIPMQCLYKMPEQIIAASDDMFPKGTLTAAGLMEFVTRYTQGKLEKTVLL